MVGAVFLQFAVLDGVLLVLLLVRALLRLLVLDTSVLLNGDKHKVGKWVLLEETG